MLPKIVTMAAIVSPSKPGTISTATTMKSTITQFAGFLLLTLVWSCRKSDVNCHCIHTIDGDYRSAYDTPAPDCATCEQYSYHFTSHDFEFPNLTYQDTISCQCQ